MLTMDAGCSDINTGGKSENVRMYASSHSIRNENSFGAMPWIGFTDQDNILVSFAYAFDLDVEENARMFIPFLFVLVMKCENSAKLLIGLQNHRRSTTINGKPPRQQRQRNHDHDRHSPVHLLLPLHGPVHWPREGYLRNVARRRMG